MSALQETLGKVLPVDMASSISSNEASSSSPSSEKKEKKGFMAGLMDNPLFSAGAGVAGLGLGIGLLRTGMLQGILLARKHMTVSLEIPSKDRSYHWVLQWISQQAPRRHLGVETTFKQHNTGQVTANFDFVPSPGRHWMTYKGTLMQVVRERDATMIDLQSGSPWETVTLTMVGKNHDLFSQLLADAKSIALRKEEGKTIMYTSSGMNWQQFGQPRRRRPLHSVILPQGCAERILADVQEFSRCPQWYVDRGIPYRRGYLLYGPPGTGKSSFITALAGELEYNICILNLNERGLTDDKLHLLMSIVPPRSFVLLEDVDAAFAERTSEQAQYSLTFSGLLNCLDGVASTEERIVFMTTNHIERLDPALIRPGRVDVKQCVDFADAYQVQRTFLKFYPGEDENAVLFMQYLMEGKQESVEEALVRQNKTEERDEREKREREENSSRGANGQRVESHTIDVNSSNSTPSPSPTNTTTLPPTTTTTSTTTPPVIPATTTTTTTATLTPTPIAASRTSPSVGVISKVPVSVADLQGYFMVFKNQPERACNPRNIQHYLTLPLIALQQLIRERKEAGAGANASKAAKK